MATSDFAIDQTIGVNFNRRTTDAELKLGHVSKGTNNTIWIYVQANGSVATGTCTVSAAYQLTDTAGNYTADTAFADNEYGWVRQTAGTTG